MYPFSRNTSSASLDVENETKIQAGISELVRNKTVLIIAHRMRTVANADKIVVLENGSVAEMGTPEELKKKNGIFSRMVNRQVTNMNEKIGYCYIDMRIFLFHSLKKDRNRTRHQIRIFGTAGWKELMNA